MKQFKGPAIGGWLYGLGGFMLPFVSFGLISTILSLLMIIIVPSNFTNSNYSNKNKDLEVAPLITKESPSDTLLKSKCSTDLG